jgi:hypothetical protein
VNALESEGRNPSRGMRAGVHEGCDSKYSHCQRVGRHAHDRGAVEGGVRCGQAGSGRDLRTIFGFQNILESVSSDVVKNAHRPVFVFA